MQQKLKHLNSCPIYFSEKHYQPCEFDRCRVGIANWLTKTSSVSPCSKYSWKTNKQTSLSNRYSTSIFIFSFCERHGNLSISAMNSGLCCPSLKPNWSIVLFPWAQHFHLTVPLLEVYMDYGEALRRPEKNAKPSHTPSSNPSSMLNYDKQTYMQWVD